ncbi:hypothetical protein ACQKWADRAFT_295196 [Trichoderma austrokoningii]
MLVTRIATRNLLLPSRVLTNRAHIIAATPKQQQAFYTSHSATMATGEAPKEPCAVKELPKLSDHEFKIYNRLADKMNWFHNNFRQSWNVLWQACTTGRRPQGMSLKQLLHIGTEFAEHLTMHHRIEETYFFPMLAKRMPEFDPKNGDLVRQHAQIHEGLEGFEAYIGQCLRGETDFELGVLKAKMESWGGVLWAHLDDEVRSLGAENMRKFWTLQEVQRFNM